MMFKEDVKMFEITQDMKDKRIARITEVEERIDTVSYTHLDG